ncbi:hypothetical protein F0562_018326 [Nyssa sinensis]|uniref:Uncharacterized protein n=1 Tax=Nyssa sinensis TaxID=561372 RepID=A0A5J4ZD13_9ASTE|nr:hypothetical protein F0562_018326 [Nyssa sinensis]
MSSSPSSSSSITNSSSSIPTMTPISHIVSIKLTPDNYPLWKAQLLHYFRGQDLYGYLDGTVTLPPQTIDALHPNTGAINTIPNPAHSQWLRQDSLILSTLMSSMTEGVLAQIVSHATSHKVWRALETKFSSQSRARTIQVRTQLANAKKGSQSANDYFLSIKKLADELAMAGQPLKCDDIISYVLAGLGHEYDSFVSSIYARTDHVTLEEVYSLLIVIESRLNRHHLSTPAPLAEANVVQRQSQQSNNRGRGGFRGRGRHNNYRGGGAFSYTRSNTSNSSTVVCQVCEKPGHSARKCYHRFDLTYQDPPPSQNKQAFVAANNGGWENDWLVDTGATHHITHDMANLNLKSDDYNGTDQLQVGNGQGLRISKTGNSSLHSSSHSFVLNQVLLVPQIKKNLLSVQKFCIDNNVYFEFHDKYFLVKDYSGTVLHRGQVSNGLYHFSNNNVPPQVFSSVRISFDQWHRRLGHAVSPVVQHVLSSNKLPKNTSSTSSSKSHSSTHVTLPLNLKFPPTARTDDMQSRIIPLATNHTVPLVSHSAGTDEGAPIRHANSVSSLAIVAAEHSLSSSIPAEPPQQTTDPTVTQGNTRTHAMVTRSRNNIFKPKATPDDVVRYPLPKALLSSFNSTDVEPSCYSDAVTV